MSTLQKLRRTGRTTRMLEKAKSLAQTGTEVYVVCDNIRDQHRLEIECGEPNLGIKFVTPEALGSFDWKTLRPFIAHHRKVFLVDHHAIEDRFKTLLEMFHAFDEYE